MRLKRYLSRITLIMILLIFLCSFAYAITDSTPEPNFEQDGVSYYLSGPNTLTIEIDVLGTHQITLEDRVTSTIEWEYNVPLETIGYFNDTITYMGAEFSRNVDIIVTNELIITYSRAAYENGQQFLTGELKQHIVSYESLLSTFPIPIEYSFDQVELVISQLQAGNFESVNEGSMQISFLLSSRQIVNSLSNEPVPSYLAESYQNIQIVSEYIQNINLSPDLIAMIVEQVENIPTNLPAELPTQLPSVTPIVTIEPIMSIAVIEIIEEAEEIVVETIPEPSTAEVIASAVSAAVAVSAAGIAASAAGGRWNDKRGRCSCIRSSAKCSGCCCNSNRRRRSRQCCPFIFKRYYNGSSRHADG